MNENFERIVEDLYKKCSVNASEQFNPNKIIKILFADDDVMRNMTLKSMIENEQKYIVFYILYFRLSHFSME